MLYLVKGLKMSDDTAINGGIAIGLIVNSLFNMLLGDVK